MVEQWREKRGVRVEDDGDARDTRRDLLEQLQPFSHQSWVIGAEPRDVAAGPCKTVNKTLADGIAYTCEDDRYRVRLVLQRSDRRGRCNAATAGEPPVRIASGEIPTSSAA
jgi:hypothetical protein